MNKSQKGNAGGGLLILILVLFVITGLDSCGQNDRQKKLEQEVKELKQQLKK